MLRDMVRFSHLEISPSVIFMALIFIATHLSMSEQCPTHRHGSFVHQGAANGIEHDTTIPTPDIKSYSHPTSGLKATRTSGILLFFSTLGPKW